MLFQHERFTMSFRLALDDGIDYRTFEKVLCLPPSIPLAAVAGFRDVPSLIEKQKYTVPDQEVRHASGSSAIKRYGA